MSSVFAEKITQYISDYRLLLRKSLNQVERMNRLKALDLKSVTIYSDDLSLYNTAWKILKDIESNGNIPDQGYYSYSGLEKFYTELKTFVEDYTVSDDRIIHRIQHTSNLLLEVIQMVSSPGFQHTDQLQDKLLECNKSVVCYGSDDQKQLYLGCLERLSSINRAIFTPVLDHFSEQLEEHRKAA